MYLNFLNLQAIECKNLFFFKGKSLFIFTWMNPYLIRSVSIFLQLFRKYCLSLLFNDRRYSFFRFSLLFLILDYCSLWRHWNRIMWENENRIVEKMKTKIRRIFDARAHFYQSVYILSVFILRIFTSKISACFVCY